MTYVCLFEYFPITFASHQSSSVTFTELYCNASLSCVKIEAAFTTKINVTVYYSGKNVVKNVRLLDLRVIYIFIIRTIAT